MPIYEYKVAKGPGCDYCKNKFEVRQSVNDELLKKCPKCGGEVKRLISRPFISVIEPLTQEETFEKYTTEEAEKMDLEEGFAPDVIEEEQS
jgi:putative FmdB family regulatory protein